MCSMIIVFIIILQEILTRIMKKILLLLLFTMTTLVMAQPSCLLTEPLTNQCINSVDFHVVQQEVLPHLCVISYERSLFAKAQELCRQAASINLEAAYNYFQLQIINGHFEQAFKSQYMLFFSNPFTHNQQLLNSLQKVEKYLRVRQATLASLQNADNFTFSIFNFYNNQTEKSLIHLKAHLAEFKDNNQFIYQHFLMARILQKQYQYYDGMNYMSEVLKTNTKSHPYLYHLHGNFLMHHIQFQKAIAEFEKANSEFYKLYKSNGFSFSHYNIGLCYQKLGKIQEAIKYYEKSVVSLSSAEALNALGHAHYTIFQKTQGKQQFQLAEKYYKKSLQVNQEYTVALFNLGMLELSRNKSNEAISYFQNCLSKVQTFRSCKYGLLKAYYNLKQISKVIKLVDQIQKTEQTLAELAALLYEVGDYKRALNIIGDRIDFKSADLLQWKGFNEYALQNYQGAQKSFSRAVFLGSKKGYIYYSLGLSQFQLKQYAECARSFDHAYRLDPRAQTKKKWQQCKKLISPNDL